jgi:Bacterial Ig-like domain (group 3)
VFSTQCVYIKTRAPLPKKSDAFPITFGVFGFCWAKTRIAHQLVERLLGRNPSAVRMQIVSHYRRTAGRVYDERVFEPKRSFPFMLSALRNIAKRQRHKTVTKSLFGLSSLVLVCIALTSLSAAQGPEITSVGAITTQQFQTIVITGTGFGTHKPYTADSDFISFLDTTKGWQAGYKGCLLGFCTTDTVTLIVHEWTDTKIVVGGFRGAWGTENFTLSVGDSEQISVFNPQTSAGPAQMTVTIVGEKTTTTLGSNPNPSNDGETVTFTAKVESSSGPPPNGESVSFMQGKTTLGAGTLSGGTATFKTSKLAKGTHSITAVYRGDADFAKSTSKPVNQVVE